VAVGVLSKVLVVAAPVDKAAQTALTAVLGKAIILAATAPLILAQAVEAAIQVAALITAVLV